MTIKKGSLLNNIIASSINENKINKRLNDYTYKAFKETKNIKSDIRKPKQSIKSTSGLLNKIVEEGIKEAEINKRLDQAAYTAINGQRQAEKGTPEGVTMLGQLNREKPLDAITKEMIQKYQEDQQTPIMVDGEARKYMKSDYTPTFTDKFGKYKTTDQIEKMMNDYREGRKDVSNEILKIDEFIKDTNDEILALKKSIDEKGIGSKAQYRELQNELEKLNKERKKSENKLNKYNYTLDKLEEDRNEVIRQNSLINQENREEVIKYEQSLKDRNKNRLNLQQQPNESEYDYYKRLQEVEKEKYDPILYKQYALNQTTKQLKEKLGELFDDTSFKENILKNLDEKDKFLINQNFDNIEKSFLDKYGFNNKSLNPKTVAKEFKLLDMQRQQKEQAQAITPLQSIIKRNKQREIYSDEIKLVRDRQEQAERQDREFLLYDEELRQQYLKDQENERNFLLRDEEERKLAERLQIRAAARSEREADDDIRYQQQLQLQRENKVRQQQQQQQRQIITAAERAAKAAEQEAAREVAAALKIAKAAEREAQTAAQKTAAQAEIQRILLKSRQIDAAKAAAAEDRKYQLLRQGLLDYRQQQQQQQQQREEENFLLQDNRDFQNAAREYQQQQQNKSIRETVSAAAAVALRKKREKERLNQYKVQQRLNQYNDQQKYQQEELQKDINQSASADIKRFIRGNKDRENFLKQQKASTNIQRIVRGNIDRKKLKKEEEQEILYNQFIDTLMKQAAEKNKKESTYNEYIDTVMRQAKEKIKKEAELGKTGLARRVEPENQEKLKQAIINIQKVFRGNKARQLLLEKDTGNTSSTTDITQQNLLRELRQPRRDKGLKRDPYMTRSRKQVNLKVQAKQESDKLIDNLLQQEIQREIYKNIQQTQNPVVYGPKRNVGRPRKKRNPVGRPRKQPMETVVEDDSQGAAGSGLRGRRIKPKKRVVKTSKNELIKNRLRLVASQIEAGNTNPTLIKEVNELYKTIYNIDNAYTLLKK